MTAQGMTFKPSGGVRALLEQIAEVKFSKHVPLVVVLLSAVYAVYRSTHYLEAEFDLHLAVAFPTALFLELLVLAAGAAVFIAQREAFIAELKDEDQTLATWGQYLTLTLLGVAFFALLGIAWADAWLVTQDHVASAIMVLAQAAQAGFIMAFIISALLAERSKLRQQYADYEANSCRYCKRPVSANNRARHEASCPKRP
jgi:hypothetical protein